MVRGSQFVYEVAQQWHKRKFWKIGYKRGYKYYNTRNCCLIIYIFCNKVHGKNLLWLCCCSCWATLSVNCEPRNSLRASLQKNKFEKENSKKKNAATLVRSFSCAKYRKTKKYWKNTPLMGFQRSINYLKNALCYNQFGLVVFKVRRFQNFTFFSKVSRKR